MMSYPSQIRLLVCSLAVAVLSLVAIYTATSASGTDALAPLQQMFGPETPAAPQPTATPTAEEVIPEPVGDSTSTPSADDEAALTNGKIVFERSSSIYTIDPLTKTESSALASGRYPAASPDQSKIAFTSYATSGNGEINIMNADGTNPHALATRAFGSDPAWSPDGSKIVYIGGSNIRDIWVMNADGSGQTALTSIPLTQVNTSPSWGANGKIVYRCNDATSTLPDNICVINAAGGGQAKLTTSGRAANPAWSHDGTRIAFSQFIPGSPPQGGVYTMNGQGGAVTQITSVTSDGQPTWSPDDSQIAFTSDPTLSNARQIFVVDANGSNRRQITTVTKSDYPDWGVAAAATPTPTPTPSPTPTPFYTISGYVEDPDGTRMDGASLTVTGDTNGDGLIDITRSTTTISNGGTHFYNFNQLTSGNYTVSVALSKRIFDPSEKFVKLPTTEAGQNGGALVTFRATRVITDCVPPRLGLMHWYRAEGNFSDSASHVDASPTSVVPLVPGKVGQAFQFNGIDASIASAQTPTLNAVPVSIEAWVKPALRTDGTDFPTNAVSNDNGNYGQGFGLNVWQGGSQLKVEYSDGFRVVPGVTFEAEKWYHIAVTYKTSNGIGTVQTYVNGTKVDDFDFPQGSLNGRNNILIGRHNDNATEGTRRFFKGLIDEVAVYTLKLSATSVTGLYNADTNGKCFVSPPPNDDIRNAQSLTGSVGTANGTNVGATREVGSFFPSVGQLNEPLHNQKDGGRSVWYKFTSPAAGNLTIDTDGSDFDTVLAVYQTPRLGDLSIFWEVGSDDDSRSGYQQSKVANILTDAFTTYYIAVDGKQGATGKVAVHFRYDQIKPVPVEAMLTGINAGITCKPAESDQCKNKPPVVCTNDSDPNGICADRFDDNGLFIVTLTGVNFTANSRAIYNMEELKGFDKTGKAVNGFTYYISSTTLEAHIPPSPALDLVKDGKLRVFTPNSSAATGSAKFSPQALSAGEGLLALNYGVLNVIRLLKETIIPPGVATTVCSDLAQNPDQQICMEFLALGTPATITTSLFNSAITDRACQFLTGADATSLALNADYQACIGVGDGKTLAQRSFSINSLSGFNSAGGTKVTIRSKLAPPPPEDRDKQPSLLVSGGYIVATDGATIVAGGGGNIIAGGAGNIIAGGAGNIIAGGAGNIVATDGATWSFGGNRPTSKQTTGFAASEGLVGRVVAHGSGGSNPVMIVSEDPITGEPIYYAEITLDSTSNPRIQDVQGLAFTFAYNTPILQFAVGTATVSEAGGQVTVNVVRSGDTSGIGLVNYATADGTAIAGTDYAATQGRLTFAPGETSKTFTVNVFTDGVNESDEKFAVNLTAVANAALDKREMQVTITNTPAVPPITIDGQVLGPDGRGLRNAVVSITNAQGVTRSASTSSLGYFSFTDVVPTTYTIRVGSKRYRFSSRQVTFTANATLENFVGQE